MASVDPGIRLHSSVFQYLYQIINRKEISLSLKFLTILDSKPQKFGASVVEDPATQRMRRRLMWQKAVHHVFYYSAISSMF